MADQDVIKYRFLPRRAQASTWKALNDVLRDQEFGVEKDTGRMKLGPGAWNDLPYWHGMPVSNEPSDGQVLAYNSATHELDWIDAGKTYQAGVGIDIANPDSANPVINSTLGSIALSGRVPDYGSLPTGLGGSDAGTAYLVDADSLIYIWNGAAWPDEGEGFRVTGEGDRDYEGWDPSELSTPPAIRLGPTIDRVSPNGRIAVWGGASASSSNAPYRIVDTPDSRRCAGFDRNQFLELSDAQRDIARHAGYVWMMAVFNATPADTSDTERPLISVSVAGGNGHRAALLAAPTNAVNIISIGGRRSDSEAYGGVSDLQSRSDEWCIALGILDYSGNAAELWVNGENVASQTPVWAAEGVTPDTRSRVGRVGANGALGSPSSFYSGFVAEVVAGRDYRLLQTDIDKLFGYAAWKWGLAGVLPDGHPYQDVAPT